MNDLSISLHCADERRHEDFRDLFSSHGVDVKQEAPYQVLIDEPLGWASTTAPQQKWEQCVIMTHNRCPAYQLDLLDLQPAALVTSSNINTWLRTLMDVQLGRAEQPQPLTPLTLAERHTLQLVARGHTNSEIALERGVQEGTVKNVLSTIYQKLYLKSRVQAALYYYGHWHLLLEWTPPPHIQRGLRAKPMAS